jgi:8-oxo-dGTP pyrophosphatase MutT (NUDIX family)
MTFSPEELRSALFSGLPGESAHKQMTLRGRVPAHEAENLDPPPRQSAVMLMLYPKDQSWNIILIKRPDYDGVHSGQIALPGGKQETFDENLLETALREAKEEVGISREALEPIGQLSKIYIPPSHFMVHPFVATLPSRPDLIGDTREVQEILHIPVTAFLGEDKVVMEKVFISQNKLSMNVPAFKVENHVIWGATAMILSEFAHVCEWIIKKRQDL